MKQNNLHYRIKRLNNNNGLALVTVIMVFAFIAVLTSSVVAMVYSDNKFSQADENGNKAYYAARSAITVVEKAIEDQFDILEGLQSQLDNKATIYYIALPESKDAAKSAWESAKIAYQQKYDFIMGTTVLPNASHPSLNHDIKINTATFETSISDKFTVTLNYISNEIYRLECSASVNGQTSKVAKLLDINDSAGTSTLQLSQLIGAFDNAIWVEKTIENGNTTVWSGNISYGTLTPTGITMKDGKPNKRTKPVILDTPQQAFIKFSDNIPLSDKTGNFYTVSNGKKPVKNITPANNGRYTSSVSWDSDYIVDTSGGNVVLRFDNVESINNGSSFKATGNYSLIIYVSTIGNLGKEKNNLMFDASGDADIYLIFEGETAGFSKNNLFGNNLYIYAPASDLNFKNNVGGPGNGKGKFMGSILSNSLKLGNGGDFSYVPPRFNPLLGETDEGGLVLSQQTHSLSVDLNSHWLKQ